MGHFAILGAEDVLMSDQLSLCPNLTTLQQGTLLALAAKDTPRTDPPFLAEMVPSIVAEDGIALGVYCRLAGESGIFALADGRPVALVLLGNSWVPQNVVEASANSLWQGGWRRTHSVKGGLPK